MSEEKQELKIGLIMPISAIDDLSAEHWIQVKSILTGSLSEIENYRCKTELVSEADDVGVIQKRIVQNTYSSDVVICDVSCKNPNVMFELGMRLAFDKPTVIIKDDKTSYSFDTSIIEHIEYPRDLNYIKIEQFKQKLVQKVLSTYKSSIEDPNHSSFLKNFGDYKVATIEDTKITSNELILKYLSRLQQDMTFIKRNKVRPKLHRLPFLQLKLNSLDKHTFFSIVDETQNYLKDNNHLLAKDVEDANEIVEYVIRKLVSKSSLTEIESIDTYVIFSIVNDVLDSIENQA